MRFYDVFLSEVVQKRGKVVILFSSTNHFENYSKEEKIIEPREMKDLAKWLEIFSNSGSNE